MNERLKTYLRTGVFVGATALGISGCKSDRHAAIHDNRPQLHTIEKTPTAPQILGGTLSEVRDYFEGLKNQPIKEIREFALTKNQARLKVINFTDYNIDPLAADGAHAFFDTLANSKDFSILDYNLESGDKEKISVQLVFYPQSLKKRTLLLIPSNIEVDEDTLAFTRDKIVGAFESAEDNELIAYARTLDDFISKDSKGIDFPPILSSHLYIMSVCQSALAIRAFERDPRAARRYVCASFAAAYFVKQLDQDFDTYRQSITGMTDEKFITGKKTPLFEVSKDLYDLIPSIGMPLRSSDSIPDELPEDSINAS